MPSGKTHDLITDRTTGLVALTAYLVSKGLISENVIPTETFDKGMSSVADLSFVGFIGSAVVIYGITVALKRLVKGTLFRKLSDKLDGIAAFTILISLAVFLLGDGMQKLVSMDSSNTLSIIIATIIGYCYYFAARMFSGDLDLISRQTKRWGMFKFIWTPYQRMFSHRSIWTHGIVLGTIVRVVYLSIWILPLVIIVGALTNIPANEWISVILGSFEKYPVTYITIFIGLMLGSASHSIADWTIVEKTEDKKSKE